MGQTEKISPLLNKKWVIKEYIIGGQRFPATDIKEGDYSIFNSDFTVESRDGGFTQKSKWKLNSDGNVLTIYSDQNSEVSEIKIIELTETELKFETSSPEAMEITVIMRIE